MFEDNFKGQGQEPPQNLPTDAPDIFAEVEKEQIPDNTPQTAIESGLLKKKESKPQEVPVKTMPIEEIGGGIKGISHPPVVGKIAVFLLAIGFLSVLGYGGYSFYNKNNSPRPTEEKSNNNQSASTTKENKPVVSNVTPSSSSNYRNDNVLFGTESEDSDGDGLVDMDEKQFGSDAKKADSDGDGLSDGDEVDVWRTSVLKADTDSDTYKDGEEILNGYNPLGAGKLDHSLTLVRFVTTTESATATFKYVSYTIKNK